jgi:hypothetical protein
MASSTTTGVPQAAPAQAAASSAGTSSSAAASQPRRSFSQVFGSYFYWTYRRGSFHYDVMVTLILLFIFVAPRFWDFGAKPTTFSNYSHPLQVVASGRGVIITVQAADVSVPPGASLRQVKKALRKAIEPVTGDDVFVERWQTVTDSQGNLSWKIWAHR